LNKIILSTRATITPANTRIVSIAGRGAINQKCTYQLFLKRSWWWWRETLCTTRGEGRDSL